MKLKELLSRAKSELQPLTNVKNPDFRIEQAEYLKKENVWEVVVSYLVPNVNQPNKLYTFSNFEYLRLYKKLKVNDQNEVIGVYIFNHKE